jgi:hypothetical protein
MRDLQIRHSLPLYDRSDAQGSRRTSSKLSFGGSPNLSSPVLGCGKAQSGEISPMLPAVAIAPSNRVRQSGQRLAMRR